MSKTLVIDFDSTFIKTESLEDLAAIALAEVANKEEVLEKIREVTNLGMEGKIPFDESLSQRLTLLTTNKSQIKALVPSLKAQVSESFLRNKNFFQENNSTIYIISGGFKELIIPVLEDFGISESHIFANEFIYDDLGNIVGIDLRNPLSQVRGKVKQVARLNLKGEVWIIGDGMTDYHVKEAGLAHKFIAFTENIKRDSVIEKADHVASSFDIVKELYLAPQHR